MANGLHELVADALGDLQRLAFQRLRRVEVPELALDHAEVGGFRSDEELVVPFSKQREPLGHPLASLGQVTGDLGADAEEVQRVRASGFVRCRVADRQRLGGETAAFGHVGAQCDA